MTDPVFVDTNVLVYARDQSEPAKRELAHRWMEVLWAERTGRLSMQVLHEFYVTVTQKLDPGLPPADARGDVRDLLTWRPLPLDERLVEGAWDHQDEAGLSFWEALVVSAANRAGCAYLLTEDLQDGRVFDGTRVLNPFAHSPDDLH